MMQAFRRKFSNVLFIVAVVAPSMCIVFPAYAAPKMYWGEFTGDVIQSANLDGTGATTLLSGLNDPFGIDLDPVNNKIVWTEFTGQEIWRSNLDGSSKEVLFSNGTHQPLMLAVDALNGKMYWTDIGSNAIRWANLDGSGQAILISVPNPPAGIALDVANNHLYWTEDTGATGAIKRANLDGTSVVTVFMTGASSVPIGLHIDSAAGKIYWADDGLNMIRRVNTNGTTPENIITTGLQQPTDVALHGTKVYWVDADPGVNAIFRADKDGSNPETLINSGIASPFTIAILGNRSPVADSGGPYTFNEGDSLNLDASASADPDGDPITLVEWELNNDALFGEGTGITYSPVWSTLQALGWNDGVHPVAVRVSDGADSDIANTTATVNNLPPNVVSGGPYAINEGDPLVLDASGTTDPGLDTLTYAWDIDNNASDDVFGDTPTVAWATLQSLGMLDGAFTLRLSVDDGTVTVAVNVSLNIQNLPPTGQLDSYTVDADKTKNVAAPGVLGNDADPGGDALSVLAFDSTSAFGATVSVSANGAFLYDPRFVMAFRALNPGEELVDTFQYTVGDGMDASVVLVEVRVQGVENSGLPVPVGNHFIVMLTFLIFIVVASAGFKRNKRSTPA